MGSASEDVAVGGWGVSRLLGKLRESSSGAATVCLKPSTLRGAAGAPRNAVFQWGSGFLSKRRGLAIDAPGSDAAQLRISTSKSQVRTPTTTVAARKAAADFI